MNELATRNIEDLSPEQLGGEIRLLTAQARRMALHYGIQIGYRLKLAHEIVGPHGWAEWLERETEFSAAAASRFEALYKGYGEDQGSLFGVGNKFPTLENLSISNALKLLAVPEEEREKVAEELGAEALSARELEKALKERDEALRQLREMEEGEGLAVAELQEKLDRAREEKAAAEKEARRAAEDIGPYREKLEAAELTARELREQIRELEARPQPVAVERDEKAIEEAAAIARAKAEAEAAEKLSSLRKKLEKAEKEREKLRNEAEKAGAAAKEKADAAAREAAEKLSAAERESERLKREAEEMRRKLAASDKDVTEFGVHFRSLQQELRAIGESLGKIEERDSALGGKLRGALRQILTPWTESADLSPAGKTSPEEKAEREETPA